MLICAFARARECVYARSRNGTPAIGVAARITSSLLCLLCLTVDNLDCIGGTQRPSATAGRTINVYCDDARGQTPIRSCLRMVAGRLHGLSQTVRDLSRTVSLVCHPDSPFGPATKPGVEGVACTASSASSPSRGGLPRARPRKDASAALVFVPSAWCKVKLNRTGTGWEMSSSLPWPRLPRRPGQVQIATSSRAVSSAQMADARCTPRAPPNAA